MISHLVDKNSMGGGVCMSVCLCVCVCEILSGNLHCLQPPKAPWEGTGLLAPQGPSGTL